ncbi:MAG: M15 family metallopeptidase [Mucilaginibacter sp.]
MERGQSISLLNLLHPKLRDKAIACYNQAVAKTPYNVHPYIIQTYRSIKESDHDYELGRTIVNPDGRSASKPMGDIISDAKGGTSWHNYGLALDFGLLYNGKPVYYGDSADVNKNWAIVVGIFEKAGFNWGHYFPHLQDDPHLECKMGQTINGLLEKYHAGDFIEGTEYINF